MSQHLLIYCWICLVCQIDHIVLTGVPFTLSCVHILLWLCFVIYKTEILYFIIVHKCKLLYFWINCKNYSQTFNSTRILFMNVSTRWQQWRLWNCEITVSQKTGSTPPPMTSAHCSTLPAFWKCPHLCWRWVQHSICVLSLLPPLEPLWLHLQNVSIGHIHWMLRVINVNVLRHFWGRQSQSPVNEKSCLYRPLSFPYVRGPTVFTRYLVHWSNHCLLDQLILRLH